MHRMVISVWCWRSRIESVKTLWTLVDIHWTLRILFLMSSASRQTRQDWYDIQKENA